MAKLKIVTYPQKILKKRAEEILEVDSEIQQLIPEMTEAMYRYEGIGLAAPQINISKRVIIVETATEPREATQETGKPQAFINSVLLKTEGEGVEQEEGCLSLPGIFVPVKTQRKSTAYRAKRARPGNTY